MTGAKADGVDAVTVIVTLRDAQDRPIPGMTVEVTASGEGNTLEQGPATDAEGTTRVTLRSTVVGEKIITATALQQGEPVVLTQEATATFRPGPVARLVFEVPPAEAEAGELIAPPVQVRLLDAHGNLATDSVVPVEVSLHGGEPSAQLEGLRTLNAAEGMATFADLRIDRPGEGYFLRVSAPGAAPEDSPTFDVVVGPPAHLEFLEQPEQAIAGAPFGAKVRVTDRAGNPVVEPARVRLSLEESPPGVVLGGVVTVETVDGEAVFSGLELQVAGHYRLAATVEGAPPVVGDEFETIAAAASANHSFINANPTTVAADGVSRTAVSASIRDQYGNPVAMRPVIFAATGQDNAFDPEATAMTDAEGRATVWLSSTKAELKNLTATSGQMVLNANVTFIAGAPVVATSTLSATPSETHVGVGSSTLALTLRDAFGNLVGGEAVSVSVTGSGNTLSASTGTTDAQGRFTTALSSTVIEQKTVTVDFAGQSLSTQVNFIAGPPAQATSTVTVTPSSGLTANGSDEAIISVNARDSLGNPAAGWAVTILVSGTGNTLQPATGTTDATGAFTATLTSTHAQTKLVTAQFTGGVQVGSTVTFVAGPPDAMMSQVSAAPTLVSANGASSATITVTVRDAFGNGIPGRQVELTATGTGNLLTQPSVPTDAAGMVTGLLASTVEEVKTITAVVDPQTAPLTLLTQPQVEFSHTAVQTVEDFETGGWPKSPWVTQASGGTLVAGCAKSGALGSRDVGWHYRTDVNVGAVGQRLSAWVRPAGTSTGRVYLGFGAHSGGAYTLIAGPNTGELLLQDNTGWNHTTLQSVPQTYSVSWYRLEVEFQSGGDVVGRLFGSDGTTLLNQVSHTFGTLPQGGVALRSFDGFCVDDIELQ